MLARTHAALIALALSGCTSHEGPPSVDTPVVPREELKIAVASVQLVEDCGDPAEVEAAAEPAVPNDMDAKASGNWSPPCTQSTVQLSLSNAGAVPGKLQIKSIRLLDGASRRELGILVARKPSLWSGSGVYQRWDEVVREGGAAVQVAYRLAGPDWSQVQARLGPGVDLYARPFMLEIDVTVDGATQTVRSPEFVRQQVEIVET